MEGGVVEGALDDTESVAAKLGLGDLSRTTSSDAKCTLLDDGMD